jgi:hypothetical protein
MEWERQQSEMTLYAVKRYYRQSNKREPVSFIGPDGYFRGNAIFPTKAEAQQYLELYAARINSKLNVYGKIKTAQRLRVFEIDKQ